MDLNIPLQGFRESFVDFLLSQKAISEWLPVGTSKEQFLQGLSKTQSCEEFSFQLFQQLGTLAYTKERYFFSTLFTLQAALFFPADQTLRLLWDCLVTLDAFPECKILTQNFPRAFPNNQERGAILERIEKQITLFEKFSKTAPPEAYKLGLELIQAHKSARISALLSKLANRLGKRSEAQNFLLEAFRSNPFLARFSENPEIIPDSERAFTDSLSMYSFWFNVAWNIFLSRLTKNIGMFKTILQKLKVKSEQNSQDAPPQLSEMFGILVRENFLFFMFQTTLTNDDTAELIFHIHPFFRTFQQPLPAHPNISQMIQEIEAGFAKKKEADKFLFLTLEVLLQFLQGIPTPHIRRNFLSFLTRIDSIQLMNEMPPKTNCIRVLAAPFIAIFKDLDDALFQYCDFIKDYELSEGKTLEFKIALLWLLGITNIYGYETNFLKFYPTFKELLYKAIEQDLTEIVFCLHFPLSHIYLNLTQTQDEWRIFNNEIEKPLSEYIQNKVMPKYRILPNTRTFNRDKKPVKVGFVYDRIVGNSPFKVLYSLLKSLQQSNTVKEFEIFVYDLEYLDKSPSEPECVQMIKDLGIRYVSNHALIKDHHMLAYYSRFNKCLAIRNRIIQDGIDVMIACNSREQFNFLFTTRAAPHQIFWSHGMYVYDLPNIDQRIVHAWDAHDLLTIEGHQFFPLCTGMDMQFYVPEVDTNKIDSIRNQFPKNTLFLGFIGRFIKIQNPEYLDVVVTLLQKNQHCVFLACGGGGNDEIQRYIHATGIKDRFIFAGHVDPHIFGHVIDLFLDTFPLHAGEAQCEYQAKGKPVVTLLPIMRPYEEWEKKFASSKEFSKLIVPLEKNQLGLFDYWAHHCPDPHTYLERAQKLIDESEYRRKIGNFLRELLLNEVPNAQMKTFASFNRLLT